MSAWKFRQCPGCGTVRAASEYTLDESYRAGWQQGRMLRRCPACGFRGRTSAFRVVRETRKAVRL